ncbi:MAG: hydroxyneurosporene methyltransferase [Acidobacteria bacterium]|nr:hydroxyneurosporene methyltransferase [Acidobacteriota bacterium]
MVADLIFGRWRSQILYAGVKLGIIEALKKGPRNAKDVTDELGLDAALGYRLLRGMGAIGLLNEQPNCTFDLTPEGRYLLADHPETFRSMALLEEGPEHYAIWKHLPDMVRDGKQNAFVREFGRMAFDHADADAEYAEVFNQAMSSYSATQTEAALQALEDFDFAAVQTACDIGGGHGHLVCGFLKRYPHVKGIVLERSSVIANLDLLWANRLGLEDRCEYVDGNMFERVPPADLYFLKLITHDWNDEESVQILRTACKAAPARGRIFIIEHVVPGAETPHFSKLFDIHMMCWGTGRERTAAEYAQLLEAAGWRYKGVRPAPSGLMAVVEGQNPRCRD